MTTHILLTRRHEIALTPTAPFNFDATFHKPDYFPTPDNHWEPGVKWHTMLWQGTHLGLRLQNEGTVAKPGVRLFVWAARRLSRDFLAGVAEELSYRFNLQLDLTDFNKRFRKDSQLGPVIRKWRGMRPMSDSSLYEAMMIMIVLQNCTVRRTVSMMRALFENYGSLLAFDHKELYCYWPPDVIDRVSEEELRALKVGYRARSIKRVTRSFATDGFDEFALRTKPQEEQRRALLSLYGIGPASVGYMLSGIFHRCDALGHISPWEQKIYSKLFFGANPDRPVSVDKLLALFDKRYGEYKMLAVHYLWEDLFWQRKLGRVPWLDKLIRL